MLHYAPPDPQPLQFAPYGNDWTISLNLTEAQASKAWKKLKKKPFNLVLWPYTSHKKLGGKCCFLQVDNIVSLLPFWASWANRAQGYAEEIGMDWTEQHTDVMYQSLGTFRSPKKIICPVNPGAIESWLIFLVRKKGGDFRRSVPDILIFNCEVLVDSDSMDSFHVSIESLKPCWTTFH